MEQENYITFPHFYGMHAKKAAELLDRLLDGCRLRTVFCEEAGISCHRLNGDNGTLLFAFNYGEREKDAKFSVTLTPREHEAFSAQEEKWAEENTQGQQINTAAGSVQEILENRAVKWNCGNGRLHFSYPMAPGQTAIFKISAGQCRS